MMETGYFEQHKLQLLATQPGVCRTGRYFHPPLVQYVSGNRDFSLAIYGRCDIGVVGSVYRKSDLN